VAKRLAPNLKARDLAVLADLTLSFQERYNTNFIALLPTELRQRALHALHACGIYPWDERDWHEVALVREVLERAARPAERRRFPRHT
jgi:hypothetical protein